MFIRKARKGQSILEYALLIGIIAVGLLIMQNFIKRGFQGGLKDRADQMGEQFSASGTQIHRSRSMETDQLITEESGTAAGTAIGDFVDSGDREGFTGKALDMGAYSLSKRSGGKSTTAQKQTTESATQEKYKWSDYSDLEADQSDFNMEHGDKF